MSTESFCERLSRAPLLADGAMGTELYARGVASDQCYDVLNLICPELVQRIHLDYLCAGAELIETNTFGANAVRLATHGHAQDVREINRQGGRIARYARDIAGTGAFVAGAIGPLGVPLAPLGDIQEQQATGIFREQAEGLIDGGVDLFVLETFGDLNMLCLALQAVRSISDLPIVAQATFDEDGRTAWGQSAVKVAGALMDLGADVIGANCGVGPEGVLAVARQMASAGVRHVSAMPNAGMPLRSAGRLIYLTTPAYFGERVADMLEAGVRVLGGCCGTTPAHIAAMGEALAAHIGAPAIEPPPTKVARPVTISPKAAEIPEPTGLAQKLSGGEFVTAVELSPPKGLNPAGLLRHAQALAESDLVDLINVTDSPMARVRMDALAACHLIQSTTGIETVLHLTTRDRSLMGIQSHLIGAHAMGVCNILALTGDPPSLGDLQGSTGVYDVDSIGLVRVIAQMKQGHDLAGSEMGRAAGFCVGVAVDPTRPDLGTEVERLKNKIAAGAEFVMTQPVYDLDVWRRFVQAFGENIPVPVLLGVLPLLSQRHAEFLHHEIPGITLSDEALERMRAAGANAREEGVLLAQEMLAEARDLFQGVYLMPSYNRHEMALEVLQVLAPFGARSAT